MSLPDDIDQKLEQVRVQCEAQGLKLTQLRMTVLDILLRAGRALGAYDILDELKARGFSSKPPTAYRALDFLRNNGFVHRIESLNAFVPCLDPGHDCESAFWICRSCDSVTETKAPFISSDLHGFVAESQIHETIGLCTTCNESS